MVLLFVLGLLAIALLGVAHARSVPRREHLGLAIAAVWAMPGLMLLFVYRAFLSGGWGVEAGTVAFFASPARRGRRRSPPRSRCSRSA